MSTLTSINNVNLTAVLTVFQDRLKGLLGDRIKEIVLYGSYARGEQNSESDVDILLITANKLDSSEKSRLAGIENEILINYGIYISVIPETEEFFNRYSWIPFYQNVHKDGIRLYG